MELSIGLLVMLIYYGLISKSQKEEFGLIETPLPGITMCTLVALRGSLCIADLSFADQVDIWVM